MKNFFTTFAATLIIGALTIGFVHKDPVYHVVAMVDGIAYNVETENGVDVLASGTGEILAVKAEGWPVKVLEDLSLVAVTPDSQYAIVARNGDVAFPVIATERDGVHIFDVKAVDYSYREHGVKAFGKNDDSCLVKGLDVDPDPIEGEVHGVEFVAHVKALCG